MEFTFVCRKSQRKFSYYIFVNVKKKSQNLRSHGCVHWLRSIGHSNTSVNQRNRPLRSSQPYPESQFENEWIITYIFSKFSRVLSTLTKMKYENFIWLFPQTNVTSMKQNSNRNDFKLVSQDEKMMNLKFESRSHSNNSLHLYQNVVTSTFSLPICISSTGYTALQKHKFNNDCLTKTTQVTSKSQTFFRGYYPPK